MRTYDPDGMPNEISLATIITRILAVIGGARVLQWLGIF